MSKLISDKYNQWAKECEARFQKLKSNEEELNRGFAAGNQVAALLCRGLSVRAVFAG